jgi:competence ComEA-like helix-hairpin-helix protein
MAQIDLNQADVDALAKLPGVGAKLAARIVAYRETVHPFEEVVELAAVPGISERMVRDIEDQVTVQAPATEPATEEERAAGDFAVTQAAAPAPVVTPPPVPENAPGGEGERVVRPEEREAARQAEAPEERVPTGEVIVEDEIEAAPAATQRRLSGPWGCFLSTLGGAVLGVLFTLLALFLVNGGTLQFTSSGRGRFLQDQIDRQNTNQSSMGDEIDTLSGRVATLAAQEATAEAESRQTANELEDTATELATLEAEAAVLEERLSSAAIAAEDFEFFLAGMSDLLNELVETRATPTATVHTTASPTLAATSATTATPPTPKATGTEAAATSVATRTPRPTATPLVQPSATP